MKIKIALLGGNREFCDKLLALENKATTFRFVGHCFSRAEMPVAALADVLFIDFSAVLDGRTLVDVLKLNPRPYMIAVLPDDVSEEPLLLDLLGFGVSGYILRSASFCEIESAVLLAWNRALTLPEPAARLLVRHLQKALTFSSSHSSGFTRRERDVLNSLVRGDESDKEISSRVGISEATVHTHLRSIFKKLHVHNRTEAISAFVRLSTPPNDANGIH
jgi:DNA-binding NarL/FixJ family response regulator